MSTKPLVEKLRVKPGMTLALVDPPPGFADALVLPEGMTVTQGLTSRADVTMLFVESLPRLDEELDALQVLEEPGAIVWVAYPKGRPKEEINRDSIWERVRAHGRFDAVSQVAVDETWSALRLKLVG